MIELTNIKATNTVGQLRGLINTMQNEIMTDQPFIGRAFNATAKIYGGGTLIDTITADAMNALNYIYALCFPENNGVFVSKVWGLVNLPMTNTGHKYSRITIDIPAIKLATRDPTISTFVPPEHLNLADPTDGEHSTYNGWGYIVEGANTSAQPYPCTSLITQDASTCTIAINLLHDTPTATNSAVLCL